MALSWNEIKIPANAFAKEWKDESRENAEVKTFWDGFFNMFVVTHFTELFVKFFSLILFLEVCGLMLTD